MSKKFEDLMRPGLGRYHITSAQEAPESICWINLLSALGFTTFCIMMCHPQSWGDGLFLLLFFGMIFGPVIFMMTHGFTVMAGGKSAWWISVACLVLMVIICGYFLFRSYGLDWLI